MSSRKNDVFAEFVVGLFMLVVLAALVYFTIVISGVDVIRGRKRVCAQVVFSDVGGLKESDTVMYRGTKVGSVERIQLTPSNLVVSAEIDQNVVLREGYTISIRNLSMLGGYYLLLEEGKGEVLPLRETLFVGKKPTDWMSEVSEIAHNLNEAVSGNELRTIVTNLAAASASIRELSERLERGEGTLGKLMSPDTKLYDNLDATVANAKEISDCLRQGQGLLGRLLAANDPLAGELESSLAAFRKACESFDASETFASANKLLASLNEVADKLKAGEGTLGKLVADPALYDEINGLIKDIRQVIDNYRDTTPISTFGSLVTGAL